MPTYDYKCTACKHGWELFQSMTAKHIKKCPKCGKATAERQFGTGAAIIFKGSGFYQTDYRSADYQKAAEADSKAAAGESAKPADAKADVKKESGESKDTKDKAGGDKPATAKSDSDKTATEKPVAAKPAEEKSGSGSRGGKSGDAAPGKPVAGKGGRTGGSAKRK
jgi:putative FmdB family regulatory protein